MIGLGMAALKVYLAVEPCDMRQGFKASCDVRGVMRHPVQAPFLVAASPAHIP